MNRHGLYSVPFFQALAGAWLTMTGVSMQFHFGEYIAHVGHDVDVLGWITGLGFVGTIALRPAIGNWIDHVGCRPCLLLGAFGAAVANLAFQWTDTVWVIAFLRILMAASNATFLTTTAVFAAQIAPPGRRAESLGSVGIGGFMGMMIGPVIGDAIFTSPAPAAADFALFFTIVAALSLAAGVVVINLPRPPRHEHPERLPFRTLVRRHWPGTILLVAVVFTMILTIHMTFLERYAHARGFEKIRWFFLIYSPTAIVMRIVFRRVPERFGRRRICVAGLATMGVGLLLLIPVRAEWHLVFPAFLIGAGHCFVFPSLVDLAADALPAAHRGAGTSLVLGAGDVGLFIGSVTWGNLIEWRGNYNTTFVAAATVAFCAAGLYFWTQRRIIFTRSRRRTSTPTS